MMMMMMMMMMVESPQKSSPNSSGVLTTKKGYLTKEGGNFKTWKRRWFVLQESPSTHSHGGSLTLSYFTNEREKDILGVMDLKHCQGIRKLQHQKDGRKHLLHILCHHRDFLLSADSKQQQDDWFDLINSSIKSHSIASGPLPEVKTGYLKKLGKTRKNWKKRWFVLENGLLTYYKKEGEKKVLGRFSLGTCMGIQLADEEKIKRSFGFEILTPDRTYVVCAVNENERDDWMEALEDCTPEAGQVTEFDEQSFDHDDDGQSDEEDDGVDMLSYSRSLSTKNARKRQKHLSATFTQPITKQGLLIKQGGLYKNFKQRWFVLMGSSLHYYKDPSDKKPLGSISLDHCSGLRLVDEIKIKRPFCFEIDTPNRIYLIQTGSAEERVEWMLAIEDAVPETIEEELPVVDLALEPADPSSQRDWRRQESSERFSLEYASDEDSDKDDEDEGASLAFKSKTGWLSKEGGQHKGKRKRWFVLDGFFLHYFKSDKDNTPAGSIDLKSSKGLTMLEGSGSKWPFELITFERVFYIEAESEAVRAEWAEVLEANLALFKPHKLDIPSGQTTKKGYLEKRGGANKSWKRRFFVLEKSRIKYFKTEKSVKPLGIIDLGLCRGMRKTAAAKSNRPFSFDLLTVHRTFAVAAESSADLDSWLEAIADSVPDDPAPKPDRQAAAAQPQNGARVGYLFKLDRNSNWLRRWFVLNNETQLCCYRDQEDPIPLSVIDMGRCTSIQEAPAKLFDRRNVFSVNLIGGHICVLAALNEDDAEDWIDVLGDSVPEDAELPNFDEEEEETPMIQGYLTKQGGNRKSWKRRWFILKGNTITYHKKKNDPEELGSINLISLTNSGSSIKDELPLEIPNGFAIITPERNFYLGADTPQDRTRWVEALKEYISAKGHSDV